MDEAKKYIPGLGEAFKIQPDEVADELNQANLDYIPDSTATTVDGIVADHNALLQALRDAGIMKQQS